MRLIIDATGTARAIYSDEVAPILRAIGPTVTRRASNVEPTPEGRWSADMGPVAPGVVLAPCDTRAEALAAEVAYLIEHNIPVPKEG